MTLKTGLIGSGIPASRSPSLHMQEARAQGLELTYTLFDLDQIEGGVTSLPGLLAKLRDQDFLGVNITHPVKQAVLPLLDDVSDDVAALGACNTVIFKGGRSRGYNTDWSGWAASFRRGLGDASLGKVVLLGAGGAGSAIAYALLQLGAGQVAIHDLDRARAQALAARLKDFRVVVISDLAATLAKAEGVVNCTPVGMAKYPGSPVPANFLRPDLWVADVVYVPLMTELLRSAAQAGCRILNGGGMAVFQAAEAFRLFTGCEPDTERMLDHFAGMG